MLIYEMPDPVASGKVCSRNTNIFIVIKTLEISGHVIKKYWLALIGIVSEENSERGNDLPFMKSDAPANRLFFESRLRRLRPI